METQVKDKKGRTNIHNKERGTEERGKYCKGKAIFKRSGTSIFSAMVISALIWSIVQLNYSDLFSSSFLACSSP